MTITKVKYKPGKDGRPCKVQIEWEAVHVDEDGGFANEEHILKSEDPPHPDFLAALEDLRPTVAKCVYATEEEREEAVDQLEVRSASFAETTDAAGDEADGASISALRELLTFDSPQSINTPFAPIHELPCYRADDRLRTLRNEARAYTKGKRATGDMFANAEAAHYGEH